MRNYQNRKIVAPDGSSKPLDGPKGDWSCSIWTRKLYGHPPLGTEPKVKCYMFAFDLPDATVDLAAVNPHRPNV